MEKHKLIEFFQKVRGDFPILNLKDKSDQPLVYFDNAATTQKPISVIDCISNYYKNENANIHRGVHYLSNQATDRFESARVKVQCLLNAKHKQEIIFTKGTTEAINLVAHGLSSLIFRPEDEIIISTLEHHSNIVPWQIIAEKYKLKIRVIPLKNSGEWDIDKAKLLFSKKTVLLSISHVSNAMGVINPIEELITEAKKYEAFTLVDGAQAISHLKVDVQKLEVDFYVFSAHKIYGPTGVGVLYGKENILEKMSPYQAGGEMIDQVTFEKTTFNALPFKFEAGTPNISGVLGLKAAIDYFQGIEISYVQSMEQLLLNYLNEQLKKIDNLSIIGNSNSKTSIVSFIIKGIHSFDVGAILNQYFIAVRTGHHCTQPLMANFNITGTIRVSLVFYNTIEEIDFFIEKLKKALKMLGKH